MGILNDIFSSDDNTSSSDSSTDGMLNNTLGIDASSSSESYERDEDGNESYDSSDNSLSLDNDTDSLLSNVTDNFSSSDDSEVG